MQFRLFPAFFDRPQKISFVEQEKDEVIELFLRQHPIVNVPWIITTLFLSALPPILLQLDLIFFNFTAQIPTQTLIGSIVVYYLIILAFVIEQFLHWYFNIYIVTNKHIVDIDFDSLLYRNISEIRLSDLENVKAQVRGVAGPLFNYGDVTMDTAGSQNAAMFLRVPRPDFVADRISDLRFNAGGSND